MSQEHSSEGKLLTERPKPTKEDAAYALAKGALSAIPVLGGTAAEVFGAVVAPPLSRRTSEWIESIATRVVALEKTVEGFKVENLSQSEPFITAFMHATQIALRNHQKEKLEALQNAVINVAVGTKMDEDESQIFLDYIDSLTPSHLRLLDFLNDPRAYGHAHGVKYGNYVSAGVSAILEEAFPEWKDRRGDYDLLVRDLTTRGLVPGDANDLHVGVSATDQGMYARRTTDRGRRFLGFIRASS